MSQITEENEQQKEEFIRQIIFHTGKAGYIDFSCTLYRELGQQEEKIAELREKLERELPEGIYEIS